MTIARCPACRRLRRVHLVINEGATCLTCDHVIPWWQVIGRPRPPSAK